MVSLCKYLEYGYDTNASMKEIVQNTSYPGKNKIVSYLRNCGQVTMTRMEMSKDRFTGERIKGEHSLTLLTDGEYSWWSDLAYHVEKYNLRLPKEFEDHVLNNKEESSKKAV